MIWELACCPLTAFQIKISHNCFTEAFITCGTAAKQAGAGRNYANLNASRCHTKKSKHASCPTENRAAWGVRCGPAFSARGDGSMLNEGQSSWCDSKEHGTYGVFSTTLSTPLISTLYPGTAGSICWGNTYWPVTVLWKQSYSWSSSTGRNGTDTW